MNYQFNVLVGIATVLGIISGLLLIVDELHKHLTGEYLSPVCVIIPGTLCVILSIGFIITAIILLLVQD